MGFTVLHGLAAKGMTHEIEKLIDNNWVPVSTAVVFGCLLNVCSTCGVCVSECVFGTSCKRACVHACICVQTY